MNERTTWCNQRFALCRSLSVSLQLSAKKDLKLPSVSPHRANFRSFLTSFWLSNLSYYWLKSRVNNFWELTRDKTKYKTGFQVSLITSSFRRKRILIRWLHKMSDRRSRRGNKWQTVGEIWLASCLRSHSSVVTLSFWREISKVSRAEHSLAPDWALMLFPVNSGSNVLVTKTRGSF